MWTLLHRFGRLRNIGHLCIKEWLALLHDRVLLGFIIFAFSFAVHSQATGLSMDLHNANVGVIDEDQSVLAYRLTDSLLPPYFTSAQRVTPAQAEDGLEHGRFTFVIHFPQKMEADLRAGHKVTVQLLIDATVIGQAQIGMGYIQSIFQQEMLGYFHMQKLAQPPIELVTRYVFNQELKSSWFSAIVGMMNFITMLAILLTGAALLRERESGTIEHLLVMPVTALEIVFSKVIANGAVILLASFLCLQLTVRAWIGVDIKGSIPLFLLASALYLFFTTGVGLFLGTVARTMPQLGLLFILLILPMNLLSGGFTPLESMPEFLQHFMLYTPSANYVILAQGILFRGADFVMVWREMLMVLVTGLAFFIFSTLRFRSFLDRQG